MSTKTVSAVPLAGAGVCARSSAPCASHQAVRFARVQGPTPSSAIFYGALFGFFAYATYDLTNLATLKGFPLKVVFVDILWGIVLTGAVSTAGFYITRWVL